MFFVVEIVVIIIHLVTRLGGVPEEAVFFKASVLILGVQIWWIESETVAIRVALPDVEIPVNLS